eukprot:g6123.t1
MKKDDYWSYALEDCLDVVAKVPIIAAKIYRRTFHDGKLPEYDPKLDWAANFAQMLGINQSEDFKEAMRLYLMLHADHEGGNVSAHATHLVGSALSDPYYAWAAGLCGLAGPLHGLANQECLSWLLDVQKQLGGQKPTKERWALLVVFGNSSHSEDLMTDFANKTLKEGKVIPGFGHAVLRNTDPRYMLEREFALKHCTEDPLFQLVDSCYQAIPPVLLKQGKVKNPFPNVDAHSGQLMHFYNLKEQNFYTVVFAVSRTLGVMAQYIWSRAVSLPIERPKSLPLDELMILAKKHRLVINYADPATAAGTAVLGLGLVVLPLLSKLNQIQAEETFQYKYHGETNPRQPLRLFTESELRQRLGSLDAHCVAKEIVMSTEELDEHMEASSMEETDDEVGRIQKWRDSVNGHLRSLQKRSALAFLGLPPDSSMNDINAVYKKMALELHPDKGGDPEKFQELQEMKDRLTEIEKEEENPDASTSEGTSLKQIQDSCMAAMAASAIMKNSKALQFDVRLHGDPAKPCVISIVGTGASMNMMMPIVEGLVARDLFVINYNPRDVCGTEVFKQMEAMVPEDKNLMEEMGKVFSATGGINLDSDFYAPYNWYDLADDVAAIMDHHNIAKASIIGFSTGGVIAQVTMCRLKDRLNSAVICSSSYEVVPSQAPFENPALQEAGYPDPFADFDFDTKPKEPKAAAKATSKAAETSALAKKEEEKSTIQAAVKQKRTCWDAAFDHPYAGALKSNGTGIYCRPCQRWIVTYEFNTEVFLTHVERVPKVFNAGPDGLPQLPTHVLEEFEDDHLNTRASSFEDHLSQLEHASLERVSQQRQVYDAKLREQEKENQVLVKRNAVLAKEIIAARQQNAELKKEVAHQEKLVSFRKSELRALEQQLAEGEMLGRDYVSWTACIALPRGFGLCFTGAKEAKKSLRHGHRHANKEQEESEETNLTQDEAPKGDEMIDLLTKDLRHLHKAEMKSKISLKKMFLKSFEVGRTRRAALLKQESVLKAELQQTKVLAEQLESKSKKLGMTVETLESKLKKGANFLGQLQKGLTKRMRILVAWDGSELSTLALRCTIRVLSRPGDQLLVYHVRNPGRLGWGVRATMPDLYSLNHFLVRPATVEECVSALQPVPDALLRSLELSWEYPIVGHICRLEVQLSLIEWEPNEPSRCASAVRPSQCETLLIDTKDFFVSHSWSHPFADSVAALQRELILTKESPQRIPACVKNAFPIQKFETHFEEGTCAIRGFGPSWFTHFDSRVCQLLATPVFNFCLAEGRAALALRYLGLGAQSSLEELLTCERLLATPLREAWVYNPCCGEALLLHVFSHLGDSERLSFLLKAAANPAERAHDQKQRSALHFAAKAGHCHCVQQLLDAKAAAHCPDKNGETPLQIAAYGGVDAIDALDDIDIDNDQGQDHGMGDLDAIGQDGPPEAIDFGLEGGNDAEEGIGDQDDHEHDDQDADDLLDVLLRSDLVNGESDDEFIAGLADAVELMDDGSHDAWCR